MEVVSIHAHFDGEKILLDEHFELEPNTRLLVTILPPSDTQGLPQRDDEYSAWLNLSIQGVANACDLDEPEYSLDSITEVNPEYEGR
jgi:hypothetical protein